MRVIQQLFTAYMEECLDQNISTHILTTLAKAPRWLDGLGDQVYCDRKARGKVDYRVSTASIYNIRTVLGKTARHHNHGAGTVHLDRQQPGSSDGAATTTSTPRLPIDERESI